jgi:SecD/SecF fusion protein
MSPAAWTFCYGFAALILFGWYFVTDSDRIKRILGTVLTVGLTGFCLWSVNPPNDVLGPDGKTVITPGKILKGLDLKGGTSFLIRLVAEPDDDGKMKDITPTMVDQAVEVIRKRVDALGTSEPVITPSGKDRILVQIPGLDPQRLSETREQLKKVAKLEFRLVHEDSAQLVPQIEAGTAVAPPGYSIETMELERKGKKTESKLLIKKKPDILGSHITRAFVTFQTEYEVNLEFDSVGADQFAELTKLVGQKGSAMAIVLDGKVISAPTVDGQKYPLGIVGGHAQISGGSMGEREAHNLASALENPLQTPVAVEEERSASASLGEDAINSGVKSGLLGVVLTVICVLAYYRLAGFIAIVALAVNTAVIFGAMGAFGVVLTLPGIAGVILTLGMAIDANVLIYERLREELAEGKSIKAAVSSAYDKAFSAIFDSNVTTLITAVILFWKASGPVKGFAVTLTIGIIASMFTAMIVTRNLFEWALNLGWIKKITMTNLIKATNINFLGKRKLAIGLSLAVIAGSMILFAVRGERNFGVDFKGGDRLTLEAGGPRPSDNEVRAALAELNLADSVVQTEKSAAKEFLTVRSPADTSEKISKHLQTKFPDAKFSEQGVEKVGKLIGDELARNSLIALGLGMIGILIYVTLRFEFSFAIGALVALLHDVIITIGFFALFGREMSLVIVGAVLTIAGYSVNDTIVVYDRIREGIKAGRKGSVQEIMNQSVNETLSRTILTGGVTLLTTAGLYAFGGPVLNDFAFAILVGVIVGTYSSIFIAAPIVLWWSGKGGRDLRTEIKQAEAERAKVTTA